MKDLLVYKELEHKGVKVTVKINYLDKTVSLVELNDNHREFRDKKWLFSGRTRDYLGGWLNILEAMKQATILGDKLLKEREEEDTLRTAELLYRVGQEMDKPKRKRSKSME